MITWTALSGTDTGSDPITSYLVYWDAGTSGSTWALLYTDTTPALTYTITSGITPGSTYQFKYKGVNQQGQGAFSTATSITAG